jgi:hypothetical protein
VISPQPSQSAATERSTSLTPRAGARRKNAASRCRPSQSVIQRDRQDGRPSKEGGTSRSRLPEKPRVLRTLRAAGGCLLGRCLRSSGKGGKAEIRTGRTPCLPDRLPAWVPVTLCDRELAGVVFAARLRLGAGPGCVIVGRSLSASPESAGEEWAGRAPTRGVPPATVQVKGRYPEGLPG